VLRRERLVRYAKPGAEADRALPTPPPGSVVRPVTAADREALAALLRGPDDLRARLARGDVGYLAEADGRVVGCVWLSAGPLVVDQFALRFAARDGERYVYGLALAAEARGVALCRALVWSALVEGRRGGATRFVWDMNRHNPARALIYLLRGEPLEELTVLVLGGRLALVVRRRPAAAGERLRRPGRAAAPSPSG
jgi:hypothetical protein